MFYSFNDFKNEKYLKNLLRTLGWQLKNDNNFEGKRVKRSSIKNNDFTPEKGLFSYRLTVQATNTYFLWIDFWRDNSSNLVSFFSYHPLYLSFSYIIIIII